MFENFHLCFSQRRGNPLRKEMSKVPLLKEELDGGFNCLLRNDTFL